LDKKFIGYFVENYLDFIRVEHERSNLWRAPTIRGAETPIERLYKQKDVNPGIEDLNKDDP
jgi:hypothetical protein